MIGGRIYMHKNHLDVCFKVLKRFQVTSIRSKVKGEWYNLGYTGQPWKLSHSVTIDIKDIRNWQDITDLINNIRTRPGLPV